MRYARAAVVGAVFVVAASGCGGKEKPTIVPAEGVVRIDGQPLRKAGVRFVPKTDYGPEYVAAAVTDDDGHFILTCNGQSGACAGVNQVLVIETPPPPLPKDELGHPQTAGYYQSLGGRPIPRQYANVVESPLSAELKAGRKEYDIDLAR